MGKAGRWLGGLWARRLERTATLAMLVPFLAASPPGRPADAVQGPSLSLSANPLTADPDSVVLRWPKAANGPATIAIYSLLGTPVVTAVRDPDPGRWVWYGTTTNGASVTNGAYLIVVVRGDGARMRRRIIVRH